MAGRWTEVGDGVLVARYPYLDQNIGLIVGREALAIIDTRSSPAQGQEIVDDVRSVSRKPIASVINTHGHGDHAFGNAAFRPAPIWGHARSPAFLVDTAERQVAAIVTYDPDLGPELAGFEVDPPDRLFDDVQTLEVGGRTVELRHPGRAHTDHDVVVRVPDAGILFAGDLVVRDDRQYFGDGYPLEWPDTLARVAQLQWASLVPGHGDLADRAYLAAEHSRHLDLVAVVRRVNSAGIPWEDVVDQVPYPVEIARVALGRAYDQIRTSRDHANHAG